jgi:rfaE bifunctional protein nucleotidyltransferase chain/domain/rfaE bifunctional protein kinase chain/domain
MTGPLVVIGDTLLDREVAGTVSRLSPEAPVPVLDERSTSERPGGAGLAAVLAAGDRDVVLVTALADDPGGARLSELLAAAGVEVYPLPAAGTTPEKIRLRAGGQILLRLDRGGTGTQAGDAGGSPTGAAGTDRDLGGAGGAVRRALAGAGAILVSDYGRGLVRRPALRSAIAEAGAPVVWDPHPRGPAPVPGARLATPNETEALQLTGERAGPGERLAAVTRSGQELRRRWRAAAVAVTMAADGAVLCQSGPAPLAVPAPAAAAGDPCGAGDQFAVSAALALAAGAPVTEAVTAAVGAATAFVAGIRTGATGGEAAAGPDRLGTRATGELVARVRGRGGRVVATGGCFDLLHAGHVAALEAARRLGDCLVVCLNSDASVAARKGADRPLMSQADRSRLLAALRCVDAVVVFDEPTPAAVLSWLRPDVWVKGGDYLDAGDRELPEAGLLRRWGGQAVLVPYLDGRSTTNLITAAEVAGHRNGHRGGGAS